MLTVEENAPQTFPDSNISDNSMDMASSPKPLTTTLTEADSEVTGKLVEVEGGFQCLLDKVKQDMQATKDVITFLEKRAAIEKEYGKQLMKLSQSMHETYEKAHTKKSSYGTVWTRFLKVHETIGEQRVKFAGDISEVADDLQIVYKDTEKNRKASKEQGNRHDKNRLDSEIALEKSKVKYESLSEEWEKAILTKNTNESEYMPKKSGLFKSNKTPAQLQKIVDDSCAKANQAQTVYKNQLNTTNITRQGYFQTQLPSDIAHLKSVSDECCGATRYQLARYSYFFEVAVTADGNALDNDQGTGLRSLCEKINYDQDMAIIVNEFGADAPRLKKADIPYKEFPMSQVALSILRPNPVFSVDLTKLMQRDGHEVPLFLTKCVEAIESSGLKTEGLYRVSGTGTHIQRLKNSFDRDCAAVDLSTDEGTADINNVTSLLKLWFRELPDPLFPRSSYQHFMNAAKIENERMRVLGLHTIINDLPDAHYATLKYLMCHLDKVQKYQEFNKMTTGNLSTIFGITLMGGETSSNQSSISSQEQCLQQEEQRLADTHWHVRVVKTILENYRLIFEPDEE
ncbi:Beta-chimaerin [Choanephora cucurbitarum]|uniref:Beta-chimaerin n=1 Tax=Choanephora cucurbitarum TaxID=101091 RepID=A0A1C7N2G3_9FUNG|nr:Beta-chimaerin [Choanephora cucurbitarum]